MSVSEEDVKPFARWWCKDQIAVFDKMTEEAAHLVATVLQDLPRDKDGKLKDNYLRGTEEAIEGFVRGLRDGMEKRFADFDAVFDYQWYRYNKAGEKEKVG